VSSPQWFSWYSRKYIFSVDIVFHCTLSATEHTLGKSCPQR